MHCMEEMVRMGKYKNFSMKITLSDTGSNAIASALAMDKHEAKKFV